MKFYLTLQIDWNWRLVCTDCCTRKLQNKSFKSVHRKSSWNYPCCISHFSGVNTNLFWFMYSLYLKHLIAPLLLKQIFIVVRNTYILDVSEGTILSYKSWDTIITFFPNLNWINIYELMNLFAFFFYDASVLECSCIFNEVRIKRKTFRKT